MRLLPEWSYGIALRGQKEAIGSAGDRHIGIEMLSRSINMQTKAVKDPAIILFRSFLRRIFWSRVNTDNRMVSQTTLEKEFAFLRGNGMQ